MDHTLQTHDRLLNELCRLCANRTLSRKEKDLKTKPLLCSRHQDDIFFMLNIDLSLDVTGKHSKTLCSKCDSRIRTIKRRKSKSVLEQFKKQINELCHIWVDYDPKLTIGQCSACSHHESFSLGSKHIKSLYQDTLNPDSSKPPPPDDNNVVIKESVSLATTSVSYDTYDVETGVSTDPLLETRIQQQDIRSEKRQYSPEPCTSTLSSIEFTTPQDISIPKLVDSTTSPMDKHYTSFLTESCNKKDDTPLTPLEETAHTSFVRRKLYKNPQQTVTCKTKGQPIILKKIVKPRKDSQFARTPTKKRRAKLIQYVRENIAGPSKLSTEAQQVIELKILPLEKRKKVTTKAGAIGKAQMTTETALAMKETVCLTWRQMRTQRKFLKASGIVLPHEAKKRQHSKQLVSKFIKIEEKEFTIDGNLNFKPYASVDIKEYLTYILEIYKQNNQLTTHSGVIPEDEIWVKLGADHGKGSFKVCLAVCNLEKPNAKTNTHLIGMAHVKDTHRNLEIFMADISKKIEKIQDSIWDGKKIKVFLHGDYDFLCKVYGISGPCGTFPCLWCLATKKHIQQQTTQIPTRTLDTLIKDNESFKTTGQEDKRQAKHFHNCIHKPLLNIELDRVSPPYLHIILGITLKHHRLLEEAADKIDIALFYDTHPDHTSNIQYLKNYGSNWKQVVKKEEEIQFYGSCARLEENVVLSKQWEAKIIQVEEEKERITYEALKPGTGPVCSQLDEVLDRHAITPQAYHSRAFIGNHCNTYMKSHVYQNITTSIVTTTTKWTNNPFIIDQAYQAKAIFDTLNEAYSRIHVQLSHTNPITGTALTDIKTNIDTYMHLYRQFVHKVIPKQHILEHHCLPFITKYQVGLGLLGEQGGELIHSSIAKLEKRMVGIRDEKRRMRTLMECHFLQVAPSLQPLVPVTKTRNTL